MAHDSLGDLDPFKTVQPEAKALRDAVVPDVIPLTLPERLFAALPPRRGPTGADIRRGCRFCHGKGCLNCDTLTHHEYARQYPEGPTLLVTLQRNDPEDMALLPLLFEGLAACTTQEAVAQQGEVNAARVRAIQARLATSDREEQP